MVGIYTPSIARPHEASLNETGTHVTK
jgi:hypothetical protein